MDVAARGGKIIKRIIEYQNAIRKVCPTDYDIQQRAIECAQAVTDQTGVKYRPRVRELEDEKDTHLTSIWGSGSLSTGKFDQAFNGYEDAILVTNNSNSKAEVISYEYRTRFVRLDFGLWDRETYGDHDINSIGRTRFFFPPGSEDVPIETNLKHRYEIRRDFDRALWKRVKESADEIGRSIDVINLRGYSFPLIDDGNGHYDGIDVNDTHPADMTWVVWDPQTGQYGQLYGGWQEGPVAAMLAHGFRHIRGSMIDVTPIDSFENSQTVDTGSIHMVAGPVYVNQEVTPENIRSVAKDMQNDLKWLSDRVLIAADPLMRLVTCVSEEELPVRYNLFAGPQSHNICNTDLEDMRRKHIELPGRHSVAGGRVTTFPPLNPSDHERMTKIVEKICNPGVF